MLVLGLDVSTKITGYAVVDENESIITYGTIDLYKYKKKKNPLEYVAVAYAEVFKLASTYHPDLVIIEATFHKNTKTLKALARMRGIVEVATINAGISNISEINATSARKTVFNNGAIKSEQIYEILKTRYPEHELYNDGFDIIDAVVLGIFGQKKGSA